MKTHAKQSIELDHLNLTPEAKTEVSNLIQSLLTQAQNELKLLEAKNQALKLELAHLRRIRFGARSEALPQPQFSLFEEDWQTDAAAIEAEIEQLPLYRTAQIAAREGVTLSLSTLAEWIGRVGVALQPLVDRLILHLLQGRVLHADETPVAQLDPGSGKTQRAYLWAYRSNDFELGPRIIVFDYQTSRSGKHVQNFLNKWQGHLLVDDYGGYKALFSKTHLPALN